MSELTTVEIILLVATILIGWIGKAVCILAGLLLSIVLIVIGLTQPSKKEEKEKRDRYCPECGRTIPFNANLCSYCGKKFGDNVIYGKEVKV